MLSISPWEYGNRTAPERVWNDIKYGAENVRKKYGPEQVRKDCNHRPKSARKILNMDQKVLDNSKSNTREG